MMPKENELDATGQKYIDSFNKGEFEMNTLNTYRNERIIKRH